MRVGKQMQFFGARVNLAKTLLYAINGGRDEITGEQVAPAAAPVVGDVLDYDDVVATLRRDDGLARRDLRRRAQLRPLHARQVRLRAPRDGAARQRRPAHHGLRHRRAVGRRRLAVGHQVRHGARRCATSRGLVIDYIVEGDFPTYGNDDDRADDIAVDLVETFMAKIRRQPTYRDAVHTQSVLTITSNVVYGKATGNTPDGRRAGRAVRAGRQPDERPRHARHARLRAVGGEAALRRRRRTASR